MKLSVKLDKKCFLHYLLPACIITCTFFCTLPFCGIFGALSVSLILSLVIIAGFRAFVDYKSDRNLIRSDSEKRLRDYIFIITFIVLSRIGIYALGYLFYRISGREPAGFLQSFTELWNKYTDAPSYMGIAENWYVTEGDSMYHIVFFPLFPVLVGIFNIFFGSSVLSASVLNLLLSVGIGISGYELALCDGDRRTALRLVKYIFILPAAFFYAAPMTESLFVLLCILCLLFAKKDKYLICALFGALAAFTRLQGILIIVPCGYIALRTFIRRRKENGQLRTFITRCAVLLLIFTGTCAYLCINYALWGNPFKFLEFQREHWYQSFGFFGNTVNMITKEIIKTLSDGDIRGYAASIWIPELIYVIAAPCVMLFTAFFPKTDSVEGNVKAKGIDNAYVLYFCTYYVVSIGASWLLSAPRYLMACISLPFALAHLGKNKYTDIALTIFCVISGALYFYMFCAPYSVY